MNVELLLFSNHFFFDRSYWQLRQQSHKSVSVLQWNHVTDIVINEYTVT